MSSLLTNSTAMTALQTLRSVSSQLATTQTRISTGQRVSTASDNAAYWSIATSMRADNAALSAVSDSLGLSAATVDTEYTALTSVVGDSTGGLTKLQSLLVEAKTAGIDRTKIQADVTQIQQQMKGTADAATFNGVNWLSTTPATPATVNLVSSYSRVGGTPTTGSIQLTTANYSLYTSSTSGILDTVSGGASVNTIDISTLTDSAADQATLDSYIAKVTGCDQLGGLGRRQSRRRQEPHLDQHGLREVADGLGDRGIGQLVDADMNQESTRLSALQVQQQLGVQALSIANQQQPEHPLAVPLSLKTI